MTERLPFWKVQSVGNDFVLVHASDLRDARLEELSERMANRRFGIGADGVLVLDRDGSNLAMRMFNPDGTEDFCGNGLRCAAWHAHRKWSIGRRFAISHRGIEVPVEIEPDGLVRTLLSGASTEPTRVPVAATLIDQEVWRRSIQGVEVRLRGTALTTGSTHLVISSEELPSDELFLAASSELEADPRFPERTSVVWAAQASEDVMQIRIWERGVGETQGCGTGASAAVADALRRRGSGGRIRVDSRGGSLYVSMDSWNSPISIQGRAEEVFSGRYELGQSYPKRPRLEAGQCLEEGTR